jgi:hypothetical protein
MEPLTVTSVPLEKNTVPADTVKFRHVTLPEIVTV